MYGSQTCLLYTSPQRPGASGGDRQRGRPYPAPHPGAGFFSGAVYGQLRRGPDFRALQAGERVGRTGVRGKPAQTAGKAGFPNQ